VKAHRRLAAILRSSDVGEQGRVTDWYLVEQFVPGPEFALEGLVIDGQLHVLALFDKPDAMEGPYFEETIYVTPSRAPREVQEELVGCAARAVAAMGLVRGPVHGELRYNDRGAWLIELAARPIGGKCGAALRFGEDGAVSLEQILLGQALGMIDGVPPRHTGAAGVMMIPIPRAGTVRQVTGVERAMQVCGVEDVIITAHRGEAFGTRPEEARYLGFLFARAERPEAVEQALRIAHRHMEVRVD
jgi:biotin carboxylase